MFAFENYYNTIDYKADYIADLIANTLAEGEVIILSDESVTITIEHFDDYISVEGVDEETLLILVYDKYTDMYHEITLYIETLDISIR